MIDTKVELYKYKPISDGYGGANLVPVPVRKLNGKFIPKTSIKEVVDAKNSFKIQYSPVEPALFGSVFEYEPEIYEKIKNKNIVITPNGKMRLCVDGEIYDAKKVEFAIF